jgi:hypothetical protein
MVPPAPFKGFSQEIFDSCQPSPAINTAREALEHLRVVIEPEMKKLNKKLNGKVSEAKQRVPGGVEYTGWAWLMFTLAPLGGENSSRPGKPIGASKLTQLTVNISEDRLYAGLCLRRHSDRNKLQEALRRPENEEIFDEIAHSLSGRRWIVTHVNEDFSKERAMYLSEKDFRGTLLDPRLEWVNASFSRHNVIVQTRRISTEIGRIFRELFNLFAFATGVPLTGQPRPAEPPPHNMEVLIDVPQTKVASDEEEFQRTLDFLAKLKMGEMTPEIIMPKRTDSYPVERVVLPLKLSPKVFRDSSGEINYWLDEKCREEDVESRAHMLKELRSKLDKIATALSISQELLQIMVTSPYTDARYDSKSKRILVNMLRYEKNQVLEFWLFSVAREIAYMRYGRLSYQHINLMRRVLIVGLSRLRGVMRPLGSK